MRGLYIFTILLTIITGNYLNVYHINLNKEGLNEKHLHCLEIAQDKIKDDKDFQNSGKNHSKTI